MRQLAWLFACLLSLPAIADDNVVNVTIDTGKSYQVMQGFGSTVSSFDNGHLWSANHGSIGVRLTPEQREEIIKLVYQDLGLTRIRFTPNRGQGWREHDQFVAYVQQALQLGADTFFLSPLRLEEGMNEFNPEKYVEYAFGVIMYWKSKGLELPYYSVINEPGYTRSGIVSKEYIRTVIRLLGPKLREAGLKTRFVITDDWTAGEAYKRCSYILADPEARQYVGALAYHLYNFDRDAMRKMAALSETYKIPVWMTEFSDPRYVGPNGGLNWALTIHDLIVNGNVSAVDYMWAFFGEYSERKWPGNTLIVLKSDVNGLRYKGYARNDMYRAMAQFSRHVRPGFVRVDAEAGSSGLRVSAYRKGNRLVLVVINPTPAEKRITVKLTVPANIAAWSGALLSGAEEAKPLLAERAAGRLETRIAGQSIATLWADMQ